MTASTTEEPLLAEFVGTCHRAGIKATPQRLEILRVLAGTNEHPDADTIYARVRGRIPAISLDTVYRTLRTLEEKGVITRVGSGGESVRFDANTVRHHHFVCIGCGRVLDFHSDALDAVSQPREIDGIGSVESMHFEVRGRCATCRSDER